MIFFALILLLIIFSSAKAEKQGEFNRDYISRDSTNIIKGIFVILIIFKHSRTYLTLDGVFDTPYLAVQNHLDQMVVVMFLFYSGYGMMEQIKKREFSYIKTIPKKRFPNLLLNFAIAVSLFAVMRICLGNPPELKNYLLSLIGWQSIGNSNWYIFVMLLFYIFTFIAFFGTKWFNKKIHQFIYILILTALILAFVYVFKYKLDMHIFWYNTGLVFALGFWYSFFKETIEKILMKNDLIYLCFGLLLVLVYFFAYLHRGDRLLWYTIWAFAATIGIVYITMKVKIESNVLKWFGEHVFSVYIFQRMPMIILQHFGVDERHKYLFMIVSIVATCVIAELFDTFTGKLSALIWKPKKLPQK